MAYEALHGTIFTTIGYTNHAYEGDYVWDGATPAAGIISAVAALPTTEYALWNLDPSSDEDLLALQSAISGAEWALFEAWHTIQWYTACRDVVDTQTLTGFLNCCALYNGTGFEPCKTNAKTALTSAGITRHPY